MTFYCYLLKYITIKLQQRTLRFCVQYRITTILWFLLVGNMQITMQTHHLQGWQNAGIYE